MSDIEEDVIDEDLVDEDLVDDEDLSSLDGDDVDEDVIDSDEVVDDVSERERQMQKSLDEKERTIRLLQEINQGQGVHQDEDVDDDLDPEDYVTVGAVQNFVKKEIGAVQNNQRQAAVDSMVLAAENKYPDYQEKYKAAMEYAENSANPEAVASAILNNRNPAEAIYEVGTMALVMKQKSKKKNVAGRIKRNLEKPNTLGKANGGNPSTEKTFDQLSVAEKEAKIRKVKFGL